MADADSRYPEAAPSSSPARIKMIDEPEETDDDLIDAAKSDPLDEGNEAR